MFNLFSHKVRRTFPRPEDSKDRSDVKNTFLVGQQTRADPPRPSTPIVVRQAVADHSELVAFLLRRGGLESGSFWKGRMADKKAHSGIHRLLVLRPDVAPNLAPREIGWQLKKTRNGKERRVAAPQSWQHRHATHDTS